MKILIFTFLWQQSVSFTLDSPLNLDYDSKRFALEDLELEAEERLLKVDFDYDALHNPDFEESVADEYAPFTESNSGCACWFDPLQLFMSAGDCACCKSNGVQCGYPMQKWCQPKPDDGVEPVGCKGVVSRFDTLSTRGGYCHFNDTPTFDCAVCVPGRHLNFS